MKGVATGDEENPLECTEKDGQMSITKACYFKGCKKMVEVANDKNICFYEFKHGCYGNIGGCRRPFCNNHRAQENNWKTLYTPNICIACKPQFINAVRTGKCV